MSNSAQANLFYGYVFNQENIHPWQDEDNYEENDDFNDRGWELVEHWLHFALKKTPDEIDGMPYEEKRDMAKQLPVELGQWGFLYEQSCYYIRPRAKKAEYYGSWDAPTKINPKEMIVNPEWDVALKEFAEAMGINLAGQEPDWHMVASYG